MTTKTRTWNTNNQCEWLGHYQLLSGPLLEYFVEGLFTKKEDDEQGLVLVGRQFPYFLKWNTDEVMGWFDEEESDIFVSNIIFSSSKFQVVKCTTRYELFSSELSSINYIISGEKRRRTAAEEDKLVWSAARGPQEVLQTKSWQC